MIVITHWHTDHMRRADELRRRTGARLAIPELDAPVLAGGELPLKGRRIQKVIVLPGRGAPARQPWAPLGHS